jgi:hypothetical protein
VFVGEIVVLVVLASHGSSVVPGRQSQTVDVVVATGAAARELAHAVMAATTITTDTNRQRSQRLANTRRQ